jgi:hypothetical protein
MPTRRAAATMSALGLLLVLGEAADRLRADDDPPWAFQPIAHPDVPAAEAGACSDARNPIDAFLDHDRAVEGLTPAPEADGRTLIRRLTFDLVGMPPTIDETEAFLADSRPDAYERLVDRLLASPHYGERWGRHWLDVVRYAETHGYERDDPKPNAWRYRDYVIRSVNADKSYDRFLVEQLAGDELPDASVETRIATGVHRLGLLDDEPADPVMDRFDQLDDMVKTVGTTFLGITIHCARCHDHKFDPISQADYYRLVSFFTPSKPYVRGDNTSISLSLASESEQRRVADLNRGLDQQIASVKDRLGKIPETDKAAREPLQKLILLLEGDRPAGLPMALGLTDQGPTAEATRMLVRGDAHNPGGEVQPGYLWSLDRQPPTISPGAAGATTGRRLALARWITDPENTLTARVIANRLWHYHFGRGIVGTPSDFGAMGEPPSHPELLDWLARRLEDSGWSLKSLHRLIATSAAYRRGGLWNAQAARLDPENTLLWRFTPRRLEAEPIRDAVLAVAGTLDRTQGGPSVMPAIDKAVLAGQSRPGNGWAVSDPRSAARRSVYVHIKRTLALPELEVLDAADPNDPCPRRSVTTTAPQALSMLNAGFMHEQAHAFAGRLAREAPADHDAQIDLAFRLALARLPEPAERAEAVEFLTEHEALVRRRPREEDRSDPAGQALEAFCLVMLNSNEFVTVD